MADLVRASRPFSWINTALPFVALAWSTRPALSLSMVLGVLYFLAPYNLLLYGVNDLFDYESDRLNPRKGGAIEGGLIGPSHARRLLLAILATNIPLLFLLALLGGPVPLFALLLTVLVAVIYSAPPVRTKVLPVLDSITSSLHFVLPAVCGGIVAGAALTGLPVRLLVAFFLWGMASHALGAIQDVRFDREVGIGSIAVTLGVRRTALFSFCAYSGAVLLVASWGGAALLAATALLPYVLLAVSCLTGDPERQARRAWHGFLGLNLLVGFIITQILLHIWGAGDLTVLQMLAWGSAFGVLAVLALTTVNELSMRRRSPPLARWPSVSVIIPVRNEAATIRACLTSVRSQSYEGEWEIIVVDDGSIDGTPEAVRRTMRSGDRLLQPGPAPDTWTGKCWAAHHGAAAAGGEVLVFLDADTTLVPRALDALVREIEGTGGLFSLLTRYRMEGVGERLFMPAFVHMQLCFLPIVAMNRLQRRFFAYAYGPCMVVSREVYESSGGHAAIRSSDREDVDLARSVRSRGHSVCFIRGADLATTRHYRNLFEIAGCWRRTYYAYGGNSLAVSLAGMLGITTVFLLPFAVLIGALTGRDSDALAGSLVGLAGILSLRVLVAIRERQPLSTIPLHPITWLGTLAFQTLGVADGLRGRRPRWRGRALPAEVVG